MRIHFIGIGECMMGDLAGALCLQGHTVTGSDEHFSASLLPRLKDSGLMPAQPGWFPAKIKHGLDKVIVGRQVHADNPELLAAQQLGLSLCSYPEYIYAYAQDKRRVVITGGEEKTLLCRLVLHVLAYLRKAFDYAVDAPALATRVRLSDAPIIILEGDAAPSSSIDLRPQSLCYQHNVVLIGGIGWVASATYPTLAAYLQYVTSLADASPKGGVLIYCEEDKAVKSIGSKARADVKPEAYKAHRHKGAQGHLITPQGAVPFPYTDVASMRAVAGAQRLVRNLGITDERFYGALASFRVA